MKKIAFISAGCGSLDRNIQSRHRGQSIPVDYFYFDDTNFPPRVGVMGPRLQAKIPKMLGWDLVRGYDYYIWADAIISLSRADSVSWLLEQLGEKDIALFCHQDGRKGIIQELVYMEEHMNGITGNVTAQKYMNDRYINEPMRKQVEHYLKDKDFIDNTLYSGGLFIYRNIPRVQKMMTNWYLENAKWSIQDQLSLPYVLSKSHCTVSVINKQVVENEYTEYYWRVDDNSHKWDTVYESVSKEPSAFLFGDTETYKRGADFLSDCGTVEDWGTGAGGFKRFRKDAVGIDGSITPHADKIVNLEDYKSSCDGIFMRHVLEHNRNWKTILRNALNSAEKKLAIVTFIPLKDGRTEEWFDGSRQNRESGIDVRNLSLSKDDMMDIIINCGGVSEVKVDTLFTNTAYGTETILCITK